MGALPLGFGGLGAPECLQTWVLERVGNSAQGRRDWEEAVLAPDGGQRGVLSVGPGSSRLRAVARWGSWELWLPCVGC